MWVLPDNANQPTWKSVYLFIYLYFLFLDHPPLSRRDSGRCTRNCMKLLIRVHYFIKYGLHNLSSLSASCCNFCFQDRNVNYVKNLLLAIIEHRKWYIWSYDKSSKKKHWIYNVIVIRILILTWAINCWKYGSFIVVCNKDSYLAVPGWVSRQFQPHSVQGT